MLIRPPLAYRSWLALLLLSPSLALANTPTELPEVEVTATATQESLPTTSSTDAETLDKRQIRSYDDLSKRAEPGVNFNRSNQSINIRGLEGDRVLTTVDGIRLPFLRDGIRSVSGGLDGIDFQSLSSIDVSRGANSSRLGSGALGGAVQLRTLNPQDLLGEGKDFGGKIKTDYDSADESWGLNAALAGRHQDTSWLLQVGQRGGHELKTKGSDDLLGTDRTEANPADTRKDNVLIKLQQQLGEHRLGLTGEYFQANSDIDARTGRTANYPDYYETATSNDRRRLSVEHQYRASNTSGLIDWADNVLYWQKTSRTDEVDAMRIGTLAGPFGRNMEIEKTGYGLNSSIGKQLNNHSLSAGIELGWSRAEQYTAGYDVCPQTLVQPSPVPPMPPIAANPAFVAWQRAMALFYSCSSLHKNLPDMPETPGTTLALWLRDDIRLSNTLTLTPGLRYDRYEYKPENTNGFTHTGNSSIVADNKDSKLSGSLLLTWQAHEQATFYAQWAQGFKAPDANELYATMTNYGVGYAQIGNPDLKPEESNGYELGVTLGNDALGGSLSLFDNHYKNFIDAVDVRAENYGLNSGDFPVGFTHMDNLDKVRIYGAEATAHWQFAPNWKLWSSVAWAEGKNRETNDYLNTVAPLNGRFGLSFEQDNYGANLIVNAAQRHRKVENEATDFKAPGYGVVDFTGYWRPTSLNGLELSAGVFNLFDKKYWNALTEHKSTAIASKQAEDYYTEAGRSFRVAASWQF